MPMVWRYIGVSCRYTCDFNITQYGEDDTSDFSDYKHSPSDNQQIKDILNLGFTAHLQSK